MAHYNRDIEHYRPADDLEAARARDPIPRAKAAAEASSSTAEVEAVERDVQRMIDSAAASASSAPTPDADTARAHVVSEQLTAAATTTPGSASETHDLRAGRQPGSRRRAREPARGSRLRRGRRRRGRHLRSHARPAEAVRSRARLRHADQRERDPRRRPRSLARGSPADRRGDVGGLPPRRTRPARQPGGERSLRDAGQGKRAVRRCAPSKAPLPVRAPSTPSASKRSSRTSPAFASDYLRRPRMPTPCFALRSPTTTRA